MQTSYPLRVQAIRSRGQKPRLYVGFPLALAAAIGLADVAYPKALAWLAIKQVQNSLA